MAKKNVNKPLWHPSIIFTWFMVAGLKALSCLSMRSKQGLGASLGKFLYRKLPKRRKVALANIQACFPDLTLENQEKLVEKTFVACTIGMMETTHAWWRDVQPYIERLTITGEEHLQEAKRRPGGIILLGGHFSLFDLALPLIASQLDKPGYMYRPNDNPILDRMIERGRRRHFDIKAFDKKSLKEMLAFIQEGGQVWYAADQDFGNKCDLFAPFFGIPAACISSPSWIARESNATVLMVSQYRLASGAYEIAFSPILEDFGTNPQADANAWNEYLEKAICRHPNQYLWLHKRFKTRPEGMPAFYKKDK